MQELIIDILSPCGEKWNEMPTSKNGRHCANCNNTVIDFSNMSDTEVLQYFSEHNNFCGRFRNNQLKRSIKKHEAPFKILSKLPTKIAACIFTFLSLKSTSGYSQNNMSPPEVLVSTSYEKHNGKLEIKGFIKDDAEKLIEGVAIFLNNIKVTQSDENGYYKIELTDPLLKSHTISFSKDNYRSTTFSYHPQMGNTNYSIKMCNYEGKECFGHSMGVPIRSTIYFHIGEIHLDKSNELSKQLKKDLNALATEMRQKPSASVVAQYYSPNEKSKKRYSLNAAKVIDYLINRQGIDKDRFSIKVKTNKSKADILEFVDAGH